MEAAPATFSGLANCQQSCCRGSPIASNSVLSGEGKPLLANLQRTQPAAAAASPVRGAFPRLLQACPSRGGGSGGGVRCDEQGRNRARIRQQPDSQPQPLIRAGGQAALGMSQPARVQGAGRPAGPICPRPPPHRSPLGAVMTQPDLGLGLRTGQLPPTPLSSLPRSLRREEWAQLSSRATRTELWESQPPCSRDGVGRGCPWKLAEERKLERST